MQELLVAKEWLVKVDAHTSTPYLIVGAFFCPSPTTLDIDTVQKFHSSPVDLTCCIMITDTKRTWAEVLSSNQFARRWRECNKRTDSPLLDEEEEEAWRTRSLELLSRAHTLGGVLDLSFEVVESRFGVLFSSITTDLPTDAWLCKDFAFLLECNAFKWRWETIFVGHKVSADILSKHLIVPLISVNHLAFSSPDAVGDLLPTDLEKVAFPSILHEPHAERSTHVKNALSRPRLATTIRRITAVFNFISDPPKILTEVDAPLLLPPRELTPKIPKSPARLQSPRTFTPEPNDRPSSSKWDSVAPSRKPSPIKHAADSGSATEPEDDTSIQLPKPAPASGAEGADRQPDIRMRSPTPSRDSPRPGGARSRSVTKAPPSDTDSSPVRPIKKSKPRAPSSDEDSEEERKKLAAQIRRGGTSAPGLRQPIKRGGKRF
ncbi:hypothetical protein OG21DRAFT_1482297 [Imleria badia]|nr:hypothetical protein OG21DRAFT_1482297 [Imleria badia]